MDEISETLPPAREDARTEAAVLQQLLSLHPVQLTRAEVVREVAGGAGAFEETDLVERAIDQLAVAGLVHLNGEIVLPTRAALRFNELLE